MIGGEGPIAGEGLITAKGLSCSGAAGTLRRISRKGKAMRLGFVLPAFLSLAACTPQMFVDSVSGYVADTADFGVSALAGPLTPATLNALNNTDPDAADLKAAEICAHEYQTLGQQTMPGETGQFVVERVHCNLYRVNFYPAF
jgi:hypothetical protein